MLHAPGMLVAESTGDVIAILHRAEPGDTVFLNEYDDAYRVQVADGGALLAERRRGNAFVEYVITTVVDPDGRESPVLMRVGDDRPSAVNRAALVVL